MGGVVVAFVAEMTTLCQGMPRMTTARCRLRPLIFFPLYEVPLPGVDPPQPTTAL